MERLLHYNNKDYSIDEWCETHIKDINNFNLIEALKGILNDYPELTVFKAELRSKLLSWKHEQENILNENNE